MIIANRLLGLGLLAAVSGCSPTAAMAENNGIAVVELFTSEGCSSCPPADELLAGIAADAKKSGRAVYCLSFHVDYWDDLGWKDRFSARAFTKRQQDYARLLNISTVYTPQIVVNGSSEFLGSDRKKADKSIEVALARKAEAGIALKAAADGQRIAVEYKVTGAPAGTVLCLAWTEAEARSAPDRGENAGQKLRHRNTVRDFQVIELTAPAGGKASLKRLDVKSGTVIAFVQHAKTGQVIGANAAEVVIER